MAISGTVQKKMIYSFWNSIWQSISQVLQIHIWSDLGLSILGYVLRKLWERKPKICL